LRDVHAIFDTCLHPLKSASGIAKRILRMRELGAVADDAGAHVDAYVPARHLVRFREPSAQGARARRAVEIGFGMDESSERILSRPAQNRSSGRDVPQSFEHGLERGALRRRRAVEGMDLADAEDDEGQMDAVVDRQLDARVHGRQGGDLRDLTVWNGCVPSCGGALPFDPTRASKLAPLGESTSCGYARPASTSLPSICRPPGRFRRVTGSCRAAPCSVE
jgi:hypothetical protein